MVLSFNDFKEWSHNNKNEISKYRARMLLESTFGQLLQVFLILFAFSVLARLLLIKNEAILNNGVFYLFLFIFMILIFQFLNILKEKISSSDQMEIVSNLIYQISLCLKVENKNSRSKLKQYLKMFDQLTFQEISFEESDLFKNSLSKINSFFSNLHSLPKKINHASYQKIKIDTVKLSELAYNIYIDDEEKMLSLCSEINSSLKHGEKSFSSFKDLKIIQKVIDHKKLIIYSTICIIIFSIIIKFGIQVQYALTILAISLSPVFNKIVSSLKN